MRWSFFATLGLVLAATVSLAAQARAHGALAIGGNPNDKSQGYSVGLSRNGDDAANAEDIALEWCRKPSAASDDVRSNCKIIASVSHQWIVVAVDPLPGAPGIGWSTNPDRATAEQLATSRCAAVSSAERVPFCIVVNRVYDQRPLSSPDGVSVVDFDLPPIEEFEEGDRWNAYSAALSAKTGVASSFGYQKRDGIWVYSNFSLEDMMHPNPRSFDDPALSPLLYPARPAEGHFFATHDGHLHRFQNGTWTHFPMGSELRLPNGKLTVVDKRITPEEAARLEAVFRAAERQQ